MPKQSLVSDTADPTDLCAEPNPLSTPIVPDLEPPTGLLPLEAPVSTLTAERPPAVVPTDAVPINPPTESPDPRAAARAVLAEGQAVVNRLASSQLADTGFWIKAAKVFAGIWLATALIVGVAICVAVASAELFAAGGSAGLLGVLAGMMAMILTWLAGGLGTTFLMVLANLAQDANALRTPAEN